MSEHDDAPPDDEGADAAPAAGAPPVRAASVGGRNSPEDAAMSTARIVSEMVDMDSDTGAVILTAAAAGAAIEAASAQQADGEGRRERLDATPLPGSRLSRENILRALAEDADDEPAATAARAPAGRARTADPDDAVAIAVAAIGRLRTRARTDFVELGTQYRRHDVLVLSLALVIIILAGRLHTRLVTPPNERFAQHGLSFEHSTSWLAAEAAPTPPPRLVHQTAAGATPVGGTAVYHVELTSSVDPNAKIEVLIDKKPAWSNIVTGLELARRTRWGELYSLDDSSVRTIGNHAWLRTAYHYAHVAEQGDAPRVDRAIEYATVDATQRYVVTLFGSAAQLVRIEAIVATTLAVASASDQPLVPQARGHVPRAYPGPVGLAFDSTVMVVVADLVDGRLVARGGGSGVIVGADGSILTSDHVLHDPDHEDRLHDVFVIGRFSALDRAPQLQCAGRPTRAKLQPDRDLALIKCDMDLDGRGWNPQASGVWATLGEARLADVQPGQHLWVLGYPDVGGGGLTVGEGNALGWVGADGLTGHDFLETDAPIHPGNSGGPVVDDRGRLVGIASAFRTRMTASDGSVATTKLGLVRPLEMASDLLAIAGAGWTPLEGHTEVDLAPTKVEAAGEGVRIFTTVQDDATAVPVRDALVMVLRPGVSSSAIDMNRLDAQTVAWGKTNTQGEVRLKQLVPAGTYTVMVLAPGYESLIGDSALHLTPSTPRSFDPWGGITLRHR